jgi:methylated-DNA-[protein]-cysteine S-methyltransferase
MNLNDLVYAAMAKIPKGQVLTYKELAEKIGKPKAIRAVATIVGKNPNPIVVPCHRIIRSDRSVGEYTYKGKRNQEMKIKLLREEGVKIINGKVL